MKVLILTDYYSSNSIGGAGIVIYDEVQALKKAGNEVVVITATTDKTTEGEFIEDGIRVYKIYAAYNLAWRAYVSIYNPRAVLRVKEILAEEKPDIVHVQSIHTYLSYYCLKLAKQSGAKVFVTMHDVMAVHYSKFTEFIDRAHLAVQTKFNYKISEWQLAKTFRAQYNPLRNFLIRKYLKYATTIFAVSQALKDVLAANGITNVAVIYNGIDIESWNVSPEAIGQFKQKYNLQDKKIVQFSGWTSGAKGGDQIFMAVKEVLKKIPNAVLVAVGREDIYYQSMKKLAQEYRLENAIVYPGFLSGKDLMTSYLASDVIVFPSICFDTFGMVNLEAMVSKKPVVATCFGGAPEVVEDGKTGYIINPYNIEMFADRIIELLSDTEKANMFGQAGYERANTNFDKNDKVAELIAHYS